VNDGANPVSAAIVAAAACVSSGWTQFPSRDGWLFRSSTELPSPPPPPVFALLEQPNANDIATKSDHRFMRASCFAPTVRYLDESGAGRE
jgi:hypothetical protein